MPRIKKSVKNLLNKSKDSALLAVEIYNKPRAAFRSYGYIVLMQIAWTSLLHAIFEKQNIKYFYKKNKVRYEMVSGDKKSWDLAKCVKEYYKNSNAPERKNLEFFVEIRNKIEHRFLPEIDNDIFGECQAMLINYETLLAKEFGDDESINENLVFSLQFSKILHKTQKDIEKNKKTTEYKDLSSFILNYRKGLNKDVLSSLNYNFRVYLIPKIANHKNSSDFALEFVKFDLSNQQEAEKFGHLIAAVKEIQVPINGLTAGKVAKSVYSNLKDKMPLGWKFNASSHHVRCWKYYKIRPETNSQNPEKTNSKYCFYEPTFNQYGYKEDWVKFLIKKLSDPEEYKKVMLTKR
jgi:hypothetical protein